MTKVSIIIPFFNASKTILSTLKSVKGQTFGDFECILIDDGSTDSSYLIVKKYISTDKRFKVFKQSKKGVVSAINIRKKNNRPIAITHASYFRFKVKRNKINSYLVEPPLVINSRNILKKNFIPLLTVLIDRNLIKELYFDNQRPEDYRLWIKLIYINKFQSISIKKALGFYRISKNQRSKNKFKSLKRIYKVFSELPNTNFFNKYLNTFNWIIHNSIQRIFSKNYKDKEKLEFLYSILLD